MNRPVGKKKTSVINFVCTEELKKKLIELAVKKERSLSDMIRIELQALVREDEETRS